MKRVWKFPLERPTALGHSFADMPQNAEPLSVGWQDGRMFVWALVDSRDAPRRTGTGPHLFFVVNTGDAFRLFDGARFLGTVTTDNGIVWHVWDADPLVAAA
jgi:hypothetical protein